jgi:hypothetical protein
VATFKNIAVPANPGARRGKRVAVALDVEATEVVGGAPIALKRVQPPRAIMAAPTHRYRIGERLRMGNGGYSVARAASFCKVVALLPFEGHGSLLYRVRSETEQFERVVAEADLSRNLDTAP